MMRKYLKKIFMLCMIATLVMVSSVSAMASETSITSIEPRGTWYIIRSGSEFFSGSSATIEVDVSRKVTAGKIHFTVVDPGNEASNWEWQVKEPGSDQFVDVDVLSIGNGIVAEVGSTTEVGTYVFKLTSKFASSSPYKEAYVNVSGYW